MINATITLFVQHSINHRKAKEFCESKSEHFHKMIASSKVNFQNSDGQNKWFISIYDKAKIFVPF